MPTRVPNTVDAATVTVVDDGATIGATILFAAYLRSLRQVRQLPELNVSLSVAHTGKSWPEVLLPYFEGFAVRAVARVTSASALSAYDTTIPLQQFYVEHGISPSLALRPAVLQSLPEELMATLQQRTFLCLHLKQGGESSATMAAWYSFLAEEAQRGSQNIFLIIGNDPMAADLSLLPNVLYSQRFKLTLVQELALIQLSYGFMGMSSGFCNMALVNDKPYVVFKHPQHHAEKMDREFCYGTSFAFARPGQLFLRQYDTVDSIKNAYEIIAAHIQ